MCITGMELGDLMSLSKNKTVETQQTVQKTFGITDVLGWCLTDLMRKETIFSVGRSLCNKECCLLPEIKSDLQEEIDELWWKSI